MQFVRDLMSKNTNKIKGVENMSKIYVCKEMEDLRSWLDELHIKWTDESDSVIGTKYWICRTHFIVNGTHFSVINGYATYGGYNEVLEKNEGLLELMIDSNNPIGYLTAEECICIIIKELEKNVVKVQLDDGAIMPTRAHEFDAGYDLYTPIDIETSRNKESFIVDTGVHIEIPKGYVGFLKSKSGLNMKYGLTGEGVIDAGYTGSIKVKMYFNENQDDGTPVSFKRGDKIIQLVILPIFTPELKLVDKLEDTERGNNGFGSTGR